MYGGRSYYQRISELLDRSSSGLSGLGRERSGSLPLDAIKRLLIRTLAAVLISLVVVFVADYLVLRYRLARHANAFDNVQVQRIYYMLQKNGKTEIIPGERETQTCVRSLFPHLGYSPCWYARRRTERRVDI